MDVLAVLVVVTGLVNDLDKAMVDGYVITQRQMDQLQALTKDLTAWQRSGGTMPEGSDAMITDATACMRAAALYRRLT